MIASKNGIHLREALVSAEGDLYVFWTGLLPNKGASRHLQLLGAKVGSTKWLGYDKDGIRPLDPNPAKRLILWRVGLPEKIGDRLTIRIPTSSSYTEFRNVKVVKPQPMRG